MDFVQGWLAILEYKSVFVEDFLNVLYILSTDPCQ